MKKKFGAVFIALLCLVIIPAAAAGRVVIDITSFDSRMPVAISDFTADPGIAPIIRSDLEFTSAFTIVEQSAYTEPPGAPFDPAGWRGLNVEAVLKGAVLFDAATQKLLVEASLFDPVENKAVFRRNYQADITLLRSLGHQIATDVYEALTGKESVFRTQIAYVAAESGNKDIYIMDWDGGRTRRMTRAGTLTMAPKWSRTGRYLAYSSLRGNRWGIYVLDLMKAAESLVHGGRSFSLPGAFDPDGRTIYFSASEGGDSKIFRSDITGSDMSKLTDSSGIDVSPTVSPDGRRLAFVSDRGGSPQIYVMDSRGGTARRITFEGDYNTSPAWSPRGDRIAFVGRRSGGLQIFTITPEGEGLTRLTDGGKNDTPAWSPDGRYIAYSATHGGASAIWIMLANGEKKRRVSPAGQNASAPNWSPVLRF
ncbi:MAG: Tol-Pal system beta propeller repeat protein TolB [Nitrospirae bacterium]|nr:Tol-Pal system beta propeller repeat protein TolB [Nitrospirota bacterium]